ncbi:MAG: alanine racemase, partial [Bacteroidia bacterium]|nr:alanine racemase [Bacteroidia bacterium]
GDASEALYRNVALLLSQKGVNRFIGIGLEISKFKHLFDRNAEFHNSTARFLYDADLNNFENETVLIKGARKFTFEKITEALQSKAHDTVLEINLDAFTHNLNFYRSKLKPDTKLMVMVKAFTYGSGTFEIANLLQFQNVDYLAVAYTDEGIALRKAGIKLPIMVMNPEQQGFDALIKYCLEPEIYSLSMLNKFDVALQNKGMQNWPIHIKLETGMHRLGFDEEELDALNDYLLSHDSVKVKSVFSHLASADNSSDDDFTNSQIEKLKFYSDKIAESIDVEFDRHILNSTGILRFNEEQLEMVRLGIGLHGISSVDEGVENLEPVATLRTTVSQVKQVKEGECIGYGTQAKAEKDMQIATVAIGYADGYDRRFGNGTGQMIINNQTASTVGNICMDMCMLDVTDLSVKEGEDVIVFGKDLSVSELAKKIDTISYELLTNISERVKRVYFSE